MPNWTRLTDEPYTTADGHVICVLGTDAELMAVGDRLGNALGNNHFGQQIRDIFAGMGANGTFQVIQISTPDGNVTANARLFVADRSTEPFVSLRFLRTFNNVDVDGGTPVANAVGEYLDGINTGAIPSFFFENKSFPRTEVLAPEPVVEVQAVMPEPAPQNAVQAAMDAVRRINAAEPDISKHITPAMALAKGLARFTPPKVAEYLPVAEMTVPEVKTWPTAVESATYGDLSFEMVTSLKNISTLGAELENQYMMPHNAEAAEIAAKEGGYMVGAVLRNGSPMATVEYTVHNGSITLKSLTGYCQENITTGPLARAAVQFGRDLTAGTVPGQTMFPVANGLSTEAGADFELMLLKPTTPAAMPMVRNFDTYEDIQRRFDGNENDDGDDDENDDENENEYGAQGRVDAPARVNNWTPLIADVFHSYNGLSIKFASTPEMLTEIGLALNNPLSTPSVSQNYARVAKAGLAQHYAVFSGKSMVGCGCLLPSGEGVAMNGILEGHPVMPFGNGMGVPADASVNIAISQLVMAVNRSEIPFKALVNGRFDQENPAPQVGFGY